MPFAVQALCGSAMPVPTNEQVPSLLGTLQAWQSGQALVLQQKPSTQLPPAHCSSAEQLAPIPPPLMQVCEAVSQKLPVAQSLLVEQLVLQAPAPHANEPGQGVAP